MTAIHANANTSPQSGDSFLAQKAEGFANIDGRKPQASTGLLQFRIVTFFKLRRRDAEAVAGLVQKIDYFCHVVSCHAQTPEKKRTLSKREKYSRKIKKHLKNGNMKKALSTSKKMLKRVIRERKNRLRAAATDKAEAQKTSARSEP